MSKKTISRSPFFNNRESNNQENFGFEQNRKENENWFISTPFEMQMNGMDTSKDKENKLKKNLFSEERECPNSTIKNPKKSLFNHTDSFEDKMNRSPFDTPSPKLGNRGFFFFFF